MGIREQIEKLRLDLETPWLRPVDREHAQTVNEVVEEVLSALDKHLGECVAEVTGEDWLCPAADDPLDNLDINPGDRIAIYRRKQ